VETRARAEKGYKPKRSGSNMNEEMSSSSEKKKQTENKETR